MSYQWSRILDLDGSHLLFCLFLYLIIVPSSFTAVPQPYIDPQCGITDLTSLRGNIKSPLYPESYPLPLSCEWRIFSPPNSILKINIVDVDIEEDQFPKCIHHPCCTHNWLSLPKEGGRGSIQWCGRNLTMNPITVSQLETNIKFYVTKKRRGGRGFSINYSIELSPPPCNPHELQCANGKCVSNSSLCNGTDECGDDSDEQHCLHVGKNKGFVLDSTDVCNPGFVACPSSPSHCYSPEVHYCNGLFECPKGEDEIGCAGGCPDKIACSSGVDCYLPAQRCNSVRNCRDNSDETDCPEARCGPLQFVCLNGGCVAAAALCDGVDDCGDLSDEENCTKTSLMTAAIMGLLACIFLFVIALGCLYRVYTLRLRASSAFINQLEPEPIDDDFIYREPPPAYSVAVNDPRVITYPTADLTERFFDNPSPRNQRSRCSRRSRRRPRVSNPDPCVVPRPRPRTSNTFPTLDGGMIAPPPQPEPRLHMAPKSSECNKGTASAPGHIELCGFGLPPPPPITGPPVSTSTCPPDSPCSSPSLSPSRESVTSSTSLEDPEDPSPQS